MNPLTRVGLATRDFVVDALTGVGCTDIDDSEVVSALGLSTLETAAA